MVQRTVYGRKTSWVARITGTDPKYGLAREFLPKRDVTQSRSNVYRDLQWAVKLEDGAIYEYRFAISSGQEQRGFWRVVDGQLVDVDYQDVMEAVS